MPKKPAIRYTVGLLPTVFFIALALFFDLVKFLFLFADVIPFIGLPLGEGATYFVSFLEIIIIYPGLYFAGAYKGKGTTLYAVGGVMIDLFPFLDHLPATTASVVAIILKSRMNDRVEHHARLKHAVATEKRAKEQEIKVQASQRAQQNAEQDRARAMQASLAQVQGQEAPQQQPRTATPLANLPSARRPLPDGRPRTNQPPRRPAPNNTTSRAA
jgi:hypothetical protein